ncbi:MAG TPA: hypothetical protein DCS13_11720 [Candidatus Margulisbacteria bacterium]|nr:MAG: hypothetical protein A2X43_02790 [Candidatus Margulisbacteria bacterium GWD2_39_127]HAR64123.1 hypothetical protein [Candidatus Margulisiibacteriota bacterium]
MTLKKTELSKEIAYNALQNFFANKPFVLFGTGTSCAVDLGFGMCALQTHLESEMIKQVLTALQQKEWNDVLDALKNNVDLESAMNSVNDDNLTNIIIKITADLVAANDKKHSINILTGTTVWPAIGLFKHLVDGLPETDRKLHVATPNYDLLAEYAFAKANILYLTGYCGGTHKKLDWVRAERQLTYPEVVKRLCVCKSKKHIRLYKVHGSLNTFRQDNDIIECDSWMYNVPPSMQRLMITPGTSKYEKLHQNRTQLLGEYDMAIENHSTFLFIGFGFNDNQLNNDSIKKKLKDQNCHGLIITRDTNARIETLLNECKNLWLVCKQEHNEYTRIFNSNYSDWLNIDNEKLWDTQEFTKKILGG